MISLLLHWVLTALVLLFIGQVLPGIAISSFGVAMIAAFVMGLLNFFVRPILSILSLPLNILTLGLFSFVLNALMFALAALMVQGFEVTNFLSALVGSILLAVITGVLGTIIPSTPRSAV